MKKVCPDCHEIVPPDDTKCVCGYDFMMDDCPNCERRVEEGTIVCPHCRYDMLGGVSPPSPKPKPKKEVQAEPVVATRSVKVVRLSTVFVPDAYNIAKWPEWQFKWPVTDASMLEWARRLRRAAELVGDRLSNHAIGYLAETHDNKELADNWARLVELLGGNDYK